MSDCIERVIELRSDICDEGWRLIFLQLPVMKALKVTQ